MRSRVLGLLSAALLAVGLLLPASAALAASDDTLLLATEGEDQPAEGPTMRGPNDTENPGAPEDYEPNFLWGASVGLLVIMLLMVAGIGGLYFLTVYLPQQRRETERRETEAR